jgi:hypothetical protein
MSASLISNPGGQPSMMQPKPGPWLSPNEVTVNRVPKVLPDMTARDFLNSLSPIYLMAERVGVRVKQTANPLIKFIVA